MRWPHSWPLSETADVGWPAQAGKFLSVFSALSTSELITNEGTQIGH